MNDKTEKVKGTKEQFLQNKANVIPVAYFNKSCDFVADGAKKRYPAKSLAVLPLHALPHKEVQALMDDGTITLWNIDEYFKRYVYAPKQRVIPWFHLGGGIGDILAFSAIPPVIGVNIKLFLEDVMHPVIKWFKYPVEVKDYFDVIFNNYSGAEKLRYSMYRRMPLEYAAIMAKGQNWYEAFFERLGITDIGNDHKRPLLKTQRISNSKPLLVKKSILIGHKSSCQMRSSSFEDFYYPVRSVFPDWKIYVHESDLSLKDLQFVRTHPVKVLPKCNIDQYLLNVFDAGLVVCTDSSAIHFREGVEKPCVCVYGAMTKESRTEHYKFTYSFNVESECPHQPCFIHGTQKNTVCLNAEEGDRTAKCQIGNSFQIQLHQKLKQIYR